MDWILAGVGIALGIYLAPFILGAVAMIGAGIIDGIMMLFGDKRWDTGT